MSSITTNVKVGENDKCIFYQNSWTKGADDWAKGWDLDVKCLLAAQKNDPEDIDYVLIRGNEFVFATKSYESLGAHIDIMAVSEGKKRRIDFPEIT